MAHKLLLFNFFILPFFFICCNSIEPPPPPPPDDTIKNTIIISIEWQELNAIALSWNKSLIDTQGTFTYKLKRKDPSGSECEFNAGQDTTYIDDNNGNGLTEGTNYSYKVEAIENSKTIDTSSTIVTNTLSTTNHNINWTVDTLGQPGDFLYDIWGLDENNVWAVGAVNMQEGVTAIIKWDGSKWNYHPWPEATIYSIFGFSENRIYVGGSFGSFGFAAIWDGIKWSETNFFNYFPNGDTVWALRSIWGSSPDDVWAVGSLGTIVHCNGVEWKKVESPVGIGLGDIWGLNSRDIYAVTTDLFSQSTVLHYDGNNWNKLENTPPVLFNSIWFSKDGKGYLVGTSVYSFENNVFTEISIGHDALLTTVRGRNSADIFIVADSKARVYHYNGNEWKHYDEIPAITTTRLWGIAVFENLVICVGDGLNSGAIIFTGRR